MKTRATGGVRRNGDRESPALFVRIDRSRWLRGTDQITASLLLKPQSRNMCCLGFACLAAGHSTEHIAGMSTITAAEQDNKFKVAPSLAPFQRSARAEPQAPHAVDPRKVERRGDLKAERVADLIYNCNDDAALDDATRERYLTELGRTVGIEFSFQGNALPPACGGKGFQLERDFKKRPGYTAQMSRLKAATREWVDMEPVRIYSTEGIKGLEAHAQEMATARCFKHQEAVRVRVTTMDGATTIGELYAEPEN